MTDLVSIAADVEWPNSEAAEATREHATASGRAGRLTELAEWLAGAQGHAPPTDFQRARIVVFGANACPDDVADLAGAGVRIVESPASAVPVTTETALAAGVAVADDEIDRGSDVLAVAVAGVDVPASILVSVLTNTEPVKVLPRGAGLSVREWMALAVEVRDGRRRAFACRAEPGALLASVTTTDLAAATGFVLRAAARRTPTLLDGLGAVAAALVGNAVQPRAARWWRVADSSPHPAHALALAKLDQRPILDQSIDPADGTAAAIALTVLRAAIRTNSHDT